MDNKPLPTLGPQCTAEKIILYYHQCRNNKETFEEYLKRITECINKCIVEVNRASELFKTDIFEKFIRHPTTSMLNAIAEAGGHTFSCYDMKIFIGGSVEEQDFKLKLKNNWPEVEIEFDIVQKYIVYSKKERVCITEE